MTFNAGIWIDHRKAVLVLIAPDSEEVREIQSEDVEAAHSPKGVAANHEYTRNDFVPEDKRERKEMIHLNHFYDEVIKGVHDAQSLLIFGPGEAKEELRKRLAKMQIKGRVVELKTTDKLTNRQILAYVREHYAM